MKLVEYFKRANDLTDGFPLTVFQADALFKGEIIPRKMALDSSFRVELGWIVTGLDVDRLMTAATSVVNRHQALRTRVVTESVIPHQKSLEVVDAEDFFFCCESVDSVDAAVKAGRSYIGSIAVDGPSSFRVVVVPCGDSHCLFLAAHHFFVDMDGLRVVVQDLWRAYEGKKFDIRPSTAYEKWCREYANVYRNQNIIEGHLSYWTKQAHALSGLNLEAEIANSPGRVRLSMGTFARSEGADQLRDYCNRHRVLPVAVLLVMIMETLTPWLLESTHIKLLLTIAGSRLDPRLSNEVQCTAWCRPVTFGDNVIRSGTRIERCQAATRIILSMLRHAPFPPEDDIKAKNKNSGMIFVNFMSSIENPSDNSPTLPRMSVVPRPPPYVELNDEALKDETQYNTKDLSLMIVSKDASLSGTLGHYSVQSVTAMLVERFERTLDEVLSNIGPEVDALNSCDNVINEPLGS